eukprot:scaffold436519_cov28-Prasinocladus_malaysianus.AAC.1
MQLLLALTVRADKIMLVIVQMHNDAEKRRTRYPNNENARSPAMGDDGSKDAIAGSRPKRRRRPSSQEEWQCVDVKC